MRSTTACFSFCHSLSENKTKPPPHRDLVHAVGRSQRIAPCIGNAREFDHPLERAVLAIGAVQGREDHVEPRDDAPLSEPPLPAVEPVVAVDGAQIDLVRAAQEPLHVAVVGHVEQLRSAVPLAVLGDIDGDDLVAARIHGFDGLVGCDDGNLVLDRTPAEYDAYCNFHCRKKYVNIEFFLRNQRNESGRSFS